MEFSNYTKIGLYSVQLAICYYTGNCSLTFVDVHSVHTMSIISNLMSTFFLLMSIFKT